MRAFIDGNFIARRVQHFVKPSTSGCSWWQFQISTSVNSYLILIARPRHVRSNYSCAPRQDHHLLQVFFRSRRQNAGSVRRYEDDGVHGRVKVGEEGLNLLGHVEGPLHLCSTEERRGDNKCTTRAKYELAICHRCYPFRSFITWLKYGYYNSNKRSLRAIPGIQTVACPTDQPNKQFLLTNKTHTLGYDVI